MHGIAQDDRRNVAAGTGNAIVIGINAVLHDFRKHRAVSGALAQNTARAVVVKPDLIIADEPTGNVDEEMGDRLFRLFRELNKRLNTTLLIATHDLALVRKAKTDVLRLADGMVVRVPAPVDVSPVAPA